MSLKGNIFCKRNLGDKCLKTVLRTLGTNKEWVIFCLFPNSNKGASTANSHVLPLRIK